MLKKDSLTNPENNQRYSEVFDQEKMTPGQWMRAAILDKEDAAAFWGLERWPEHFLAPDNDHGYGLLSMAIKHHRTGVVAQIVARCAPECLVQWGAQVDEQGKRLLCYAIAQPDTQMLSLLIHQAGFDVRGVLDEIRGGHALHVAAFFGRHPHVALLCQSGAELDVKNHEGHTPWDVALHFHPSFAGCLLQQSHGQEADHTSAWQCLAEHNRHFPDEPHFSKEEKDRFTDRCREHIAQYAESIDQKKTALIEQIVVKDPQAVAMACDHLGDQYFNQAWLIHLSQEEQVTPEELAAWEQAALFYNAAMRHQSEPESDQRLIALEASVLHCVVRRPYVPEHYFSPQVWRTLASKKMICDTELLLSEQQSIEDWLIQNNQSIKLLWSGLLDEAQKLLGPGPCPFILVGLGSLGRGEATLGSDMKWGIMLPNEHESKRNHPYFLGLSRWLQLKILNLGQTPLSLGAVGPGKTEYTLTPQGLRIDDAGYCPLGHPWLGSQPVDEQPRLLGSINYWIEDIMGLLWKAERTPSEEVQYEQKVNLFYTLLSATCLAATTAVKNPEAWIEAYQQALRNHLYPKKWVKFFRYKAPESLRKTWSLSMIKKHLQEDALMDPHAGGGLNIKIFYRSLTLWVHDLALYHRIPQGNTITELDTLKQKKIIHSSLHKQLTEAWKGIMHWRVGVQQHYGTEWEMVWHPDMPQADYVVPPMWPLPEPFFIDNQGIAGLEAVYRVLLAFRDALVEFHRHPKGNDLIELDVYSQTVSEYYSALASNRVAQHTVFRPSCSGTEASMIYWKNPTTPGSDLEVDLWGAMYSGHSDACRWLYTRIDDPKPDVYLQQYTTAMLDQDTMPTSTAIIQYLLQKKAHPDVHNDHQKTPLYASAVRGHASIMQCLLEAKADPNCALAGCHMIPWRGDVYPECGDLWVAHCQENQRLSKLFATCLQHVAYGQQDEAQTILKTHPEFVVCRGDVTDYSQRTFKGITAFQYSLWALDVYMVNMMVPYFEQIQARDAMGQQSRQWRTASQAYLGDPKFPMKPGTDYFDYGPSSVAYTAYLSYCEDPDRQEDEANQLWGAVGQQQSYWPAHFALEMTTPERPPERADFNQAKRPLSATAKGYEFEPGFDRHRDEAWFFKCGSAAVVWRGYQKWCADWGSHVREIGDQSMRMMGNDNKALALLSETRIGSLKALRAELEGAQSQESEQDRPKVGR